MGWTWSEMSLANLVCRPKIDSYVKIEQMELTDFLHAGTNSHTLIDDWNF